ncbi:extracellular solute-binding protein [Bacillus niameyensis]|uniref:extracellular solute-binding protein n=1 Tax=Bacillus niameyensis TaxID=1522308 RepID=UPI0007829E6F|nr:extracellular solute-binding protein [Bacillus niameyensis]
MRSRKLMIIIIAAVLIILAACSNKEAGSDVNEEKVANFNKTGFPVVNKPITIEFMTGKSPLTSDDYNQVLVWKEYEKMTNIHIDWGLVPNEGLAEKRNISLATGKYPEVLYSAGVPNADILKYGEQGIFLELSDLIDEHMPNLKRLFEEYPEIKMGLTFPDGKIYSLPTIYSPDYTSILVVNRPWIKEDWLEQLGMDIPQTTDEFYNYLKKVKETDLNGDGSNNEIPFGSTTIATLLYYLNGSFGVGNRGIRHSFLDMDPETNELRFYRISDRYKELLQYVNKLYEEGLIEQNIYSIEEMQFQATGSEGLYGSSVTSNPESRWGIEGEYVGMEPLTGPHGDKMHAYIGSPLSHTGSFIITDKNKHPEATARWMDYFYSDEGARLFFMGLKDKTYKEDENGELEYVDEITNNPDGKTIQQAQSEYFTWLGGGYPGIVKKDYFKSLPSSLEATEKLKPYLIDEVWSTFIYTQEEGKKLLPLETDIAKYANEMSDKFITGTISFEQWDEYVKEIKKLGLDEYMKIQNAAYERYKNS